MDAINILVGINLFVTMTSQISAAKTGIKTSLSKVAKKPKTYLQKLPPNISAVLTLLIVLGIFSIGILQPEDFESYFNIRVIGLVIFVIFSWLQIKAFKTLGNSYSQEIVILKEHELHTSGLYKTANAHGGHLRADVLHGVVDRETRRHHAARRVDVERDVLGRVFAFQEQKLRADQARHVIFHRTGEEDDAFLQHPRIDVVGPLAAVGGFHHHGDQAVHVSVDGIAFAHGRKVLG